MIRLGSRLLALALLFLLTASVVPSTGASLSASAGGAARVADVSAQAKPACKDKAFKVYGNHAWKKTLKWRYNPKKAVKHLPKKKVLQAIKRGGKNMAQGKTDCGIKKKIKASIAYQGTTKVRPNITKAPGGANCGIPDGKNTVGWGPIGGDSIGWTCLWWNGKRIIEADILLKPVKRWTIGVPKNCTSGVDLQSLVTHEWGHAFGLDHVSEAHFNLVMPHIVEGCSLSDRTLGRGDYLGLKKLYGTR